MTDANKENKKNAEVSVDEGAAKEARRNRIAATMCMLYLLLSLAFLTWLLFDTWIDRHTFMAGLFRYDPTHERLNSAAFHLVAYTIIGGGLGAIVNGIRSCVNYHPGFDRKKSGNT